MYSQEGNILNLFVTDIDSHEEKQQTTDLISKDDIHNIDLDHSNATSQLSLRHSEYFPRRIIELM